MAITATHFNPRKYKTRIKKISKYICLYSEKQNIDPYLVLSVIRHESFFRPKSISRTNDYGLMQLNHKYFGGTCNLLKIKCNIKKGAKFLARIKRKPSKSHWLRRYNWCNRRHHLRVLWLRSAYKKSKPRLYKIIRLRKYTDLKLTYKCINDGSLCMRKRE